MTIFYISLNIQGFSLKVRFNTNSGTRKLGINRIPLFKSLYWTMNMENDNECDDDDDDDDGADGDDDSNRGLSCSGDTCDSQAPNPISFRPN